MFEKPVQVLPFVNYLDKQHKNINFPFVSKGVSFSPLGVTISREKDKFTTSVLRKDAFSGAYTNFSSFIALKYKFTLISRFYIRTTASDFSKFHFDVGAVQKKHFYRIAYRRKFVEKYISKFPNNIYVERGVAATVPRLEFRIVLSYSGGIFSITKKRLTTCAAVNV